MTEPTLAEVGQEDCAKSWRKSRPGGGRNRCTSPRRDKLSTLQGKEQKGGGGGGAACWKHREEGCERQMGVRERPEQIVPYGTW